MRVAVHIRPLVENELAKGCQEILEVAPNSSQVRGVRASHSMLLALGCEPSLQQPKTHHHHGAATALSPMIPPCPPCADCCRGSQVHI